MRRRAFGWVAAHRRLVAVGVVTLGVVAAGAAVVVGNGGGDRRTRLQTAGASGGPGGSGEPGLGRPPGAQTALPGRDGGGTGRIVTGAPDVAGSLPSNPFRLVRWRGASYACALRADASGYAQCARYFGQPPTAIVSPTLWCKADDTCVEYDPARYFEVQFEGQDFICGPAKDFASSHHDCVRYFGGAGPFFLFDPDLYCTAALWAGQPECSRLWYPDVLRRYDIRVIGGQHYVCRTAFGPYSSPGDKDCARYSGGNPDLAGSPTLFCSPDEFGSGLTCRPDYYPSEERDVEFVEIDYQKHACKKTWQGLECWRYYSGSPRRAMSGSPDYYCNRYGCSRTGYPKPDYGGW